MVRMQGKIAFLPSHRPVDLLQNDLSFQFVTIGTCAVKCIDIWQHAHQEETGSQLFQSQT